MYELVSTINSKFKINMRLTSTKYAEICFIHD